MKGYFMSVVCWLCMVCATGANADERKCSDQAVHHLYQGFEIQTIDQLDWMARDTFTNGYPNAVPGEIAGDFDGDNKEDCALMISGVDKKMTKLVVLLNRDEGYEEVFSLDASGYADEVFLTKVSPGLKVKAAEGLEDEVEMLLRSDAIEMIYVGKAAIILYWDNHSSKIMTIQTAD